MCCGKADEERPKLNQVIPFIIFLYKYQDKIMLINVQSGFHLFGVPSKNIHCTRGVQLIFELNEHALSCISI